MKIFVNTVCKTALRLLLVSSVAVALPLMAQNSEDHSSHDQKVSAALVKKVRDGVSKFADVNVAVNAGYGPLFGCVTGPDHGAMGIHYVSGAALASAVNGFDTSKPQALIYEPDGNALRLVGVEFIVDAKTWLAAHPTPPVLDGQVFNFVDAPNRFTIPAFFELHVWAFRDNPQGAFVDWNNKVTCEKQRELDQPQ